MAFKMKNTAYYKKKFTESEMASPYPKSSFTKEKNLPEEEQQRITDKKKKESKLLPSEDPATELTTENDRIQEQIVNLEQRIEFIGETINREGDRATKQQRDDLANLHKQLVALRKQQK